MDQEFNTNTDEKEAPSVFFSWEIPEFTEHYRGKLWYLGVIAVGVALIIYSVLTANFLFALIVILAAFIVFLKSYKQTSNLLFQITEDGIEVGSQFFKYDRFKSFYIVYDPPAVKKIFFVLSGPFPPISVPLLDKNPLLIREKILEYLEEDKERNQQSVDDQLEAIFKL